MGVTTMQGTDVAGSPLAVSWLRWLLTITFVAAIPFFLVGTTVRSLALDRDLMLRGFQENGVSSTTRLDQAQLERVAGAFVEYFQAPPGRMDVQVQVNGQQRPLFNDREITHMEDVQALIQMFFRLQLIAGVLILARVLYALAVEQSFRLLGRDLLWSAGLVIGMVALIGVLSLVDFDGLWTRFHQVAFRNNLWLLDPSRDYLIMLFPEPAWFSYTIRFAVMTAAMTLGVAVIGFAATRAGPPPGR